MIKLIINLAYIVLIDVIPTALMVSNSKVLRHGGLASQTSVLAENVLAGWAKEYKDIENARLRNPMRFCSLLARGRFDQV